MKVLVLITKMDRGGAETFVMNYMRHFNRDVIQYDFLVNRQEPGAYEEEIQDLGGHIYRMSPMYPQYFARYKREFRAFIREHPEYRIIHSNLEERSYFPLRIASEEGVPVRIAHAHNVYRGVNPKMVFRDYFRSRLPPYVTDKFACSLQAGKWLFGNGVLSDRRFKIVRNAIEVDRYAYRPKVREDLRMRLSLGQRLVVGNTGRLTGQKNQAFLMDVFSAVKKVRRDAVLLLVGEGELKRSLERKADELGIRSSVIFAGSVPDVEDYLQVMDVFVFPSLYEGLPLSMVEAQAAGLPCIASDRVPRSVKLTSSVSFLSLEDRPESWADKVLRSADSKRCDRRDSVRQGGYDIRDAAPKLQDFYLSALNRTGAQAV